MKSASIVQLLKVGHFLFQKQIRLQKFFNVNCNYFEEEIKLLLNVILNHMGIVRGKDNSTLVVNTDHYEYITEMFWNYCNGQVSLEEMVDLIQALKMDRLQYVAANGETLTSINATDSINVLFEVKHMIQIKRNKLNHLTAGQSGFLRAEMKIVQVALEELGKKRYV